MTRSDTAMSLAARWGLILSLQLVSGLFLGCNDGNSSKSDTTTDSSSAQDSTSASDSTSSDSRDIGGNNPNLLVAIGDSITAGSQITGPSYPQRLSSILGKSVQNRGVPGAFSSAAAGQASGALSQKPAYLLMMFGSNDVFHEIPTSTIANNIAAAVRMAKAQKTIPVVATIPPNLRSTYENGYVASINSQIKAMAAREGALLADVNPEFGSGSGLIQADGFHPNETGTQIIAFAFADAIR